MEIFYILFSPDVASFIYKIVLPFLTNCAHIIVREKKCYSPLHVRVWNGSVTVHKLTVSWPRSNLGKQPTSSPLACSMGQVIKQ